MLYNREFREHLKSGSHFWMRIDSDEETAFAIHESDHPLRFQISRLRLNVKSLRVLHFLEPSLRIVPLSDQIFTAVILTTSTDRLYEEFPAYSSVLLRLAIVNLRTVIVTAAVHWGFSSKLHLAVDLSL